MLHLKGGNSQIKIFSGWILRVKRETLLITSSSF